MGHIKKGDILSPYAAEKKTLLLFRNQLKKIKRCRQGNKRGERDHGLFFYQGRKSRIVPLEGGGHSVGEVSSSLKGKGGRRRVDRVGENFPPYDDRGKRGGDGISSGR